VLHTVPWALPLGQEGRSAAATHGAEQVLTLRPASRRKKGPTMTAEIGEVAPEFSLPTANNETISLAQFKGQKHVILSFHVFNFTSG
jgi:alkyl hydroperoxide reductase subunit AhpC